MRLVSHGGLRAGTDYDRAAAGAKGAADILRDPFFPARFVMFQSLSERLSATVQRLRGRGRLTEANIRESLREVRIALLEADVALPVVQALIQRVQVKALGQDVLKSLTPGQALVKVVRDELTAVMGTQN